MYRQLSFVVPIDCSSLVRAIGILSFRFLRIPSGQRNLTRRGQSLSVYLKGSEIPNNWLLKLVAWTNRTDLIWKRSDVLSLDLVLKRMCLLRSNRKCFLFLLSHGFKSNVRNNRPDLTSTQQHESCTVTRTALSTPLSKIITFSRKAELKGQRNISYGERAQWFIVSGPCHSERFVFLC